MRVIRSLPSSQISNPADERKPERDRWDPSRYSIEELKQIRAALVLMAEDRRQRPPDLTEDDPEILPPGDEVPSG
jgi:hypothetical protein